MNSPKERRPSKSLSILSKNSDTSSLHQEGVMVTETESCTYMEVSQPEELSTLCHSSLVSLPSPSLSALSNILRI